MASTRAVALAIVGVAVATAAGIVGLSGRPAPPVAAQLPIDGPPPAETHRAIGPQAPVAAPPRPGG